MKHAQLVEKTSFVSQYGGIKLKICLYLSILIDFSNPIFLARFSHRSPITDPNYLAVLAMYIYIYVIIIRPPSPRWQHCL